MKAGIPEKFANELTEVDALLSDKIESKLSSVPGKALCQLGNSIHVWFAYH